MLRHQSRFGAVRFAFTDRWGGVSASPYDQLNLGSHVGDDPVAVAVNRSLVAAALGLTTVDVSYMSQVHGAEVAVVDGPWGDSAPEVDALVTTTPGRALAVLVADCVPVLLADPVAGVVGVAHAGRAGLVAGVVPAAVAAMRAVGAREIVARLGPSVCGRCYEVPAAMRADVAERVPEAWAVSSSGTASLDVAAGVLAQLRFDGVDAEAVGVCTREDVASYSYRRARRTGRFAGLAGLA